MKNRIEELKKQFTHTITDYSLGIDSSEEVLDVDKFAEEIIRECTHIAWLNTDQTNDAHVKILKNFGLA